MGAFAATLLAAVAAQAQDLAGARAFVGRLYAHYPTANRNPAFDPLAAPVEARVFDPSLVRLLDDDRRLAQGEVGSLDGDPLCDCQDDGGMRFTLRSVRAAGANAATAIVIRHATPGDEPAALPITLDLVRLTGGWRIRDIHTPDTPSLRALLEDGAREMKAK